MLEESGFVDVVIGEAVDTFGGANGERQGPRVRGVRLRVHGDPSSSSEWEDVDGVVREAPVDRDDCDALGLGLGDEHAVKPVVVVPGERASREWA